MGIHKNSYPIFLFFSVTYAAVQCYACNPCGTTWNPAAANVIQTSNPNDYCRVSILNSLIKIKFSLLTRKQ